MSGTNFKGGIGVRNQYDGSVGNGSNVNAISKFIRKTAVIHCDAQTVETQTGFTLPANAVVYDVMLNVLTADAAITVDVGTMGASDDPDGYLDAVSLAVAGLVQGALEDGGVTLGVLLYEEAGTGGDVANARRNNITAGGDPISYTCSAGADTAVFDIIIEYSEVVNEAQ